MASEEAPPVRLNNLRQLAAVGKLPTALNWIEDFLASGEPLVVFADHIAIQQALLDRFPGAVHIMGADSAQARQRAIDDFQREDGPQLIVCSLRAGSQGITLTRASNVAFMELDWTPARHDQAEDRLHRIGQEDSVTAWYLLAPNTIDESMAEVLERKRPDRRRDRWSGQGRGAAGGDGAGAAAETSREQGAPARTPGIGRSSHSPHSRRRRRAG